MAGKRCLEIKVCKYSVRGESFCSPLKQKLQKVYYELNLESSEDCPLVFLMGVRSNVRVHNSCIYQAGLLSLMDDSLIKKKAQSQFDSTCFAQNEQMQLDQ